MPKLSVGEVSALLRYDVTAAKLYWLSRSPDMFSDGRRPAIAQSNAWNARYAGKEAFTNLNNKGYREGKIHNRHYLAHRIMWLMHYGTWPAGQLDHINGDPLDNRIVNLRDVSQSENQRNAKMPVTNTSGIHGVHWKKADKKWVAQISAEGKKKYLGSFDDLESARSARKAAEEKYKFHENHGRTS